MITRELPIGRPAGSYNCGSRALLLRFEAEILRGSIFSSKTGVYGATTGQYCGSLSCTTASPRRETRRGFRRHRKDGSCRKIPPERRGEFNLTPAPPLETSFSFRRIWMDQRGERLADKGQFWWQRNKKNNGVSLAELLACRIPSANSNRTSSDIVSEISNRVSPNPSRRVSPRLFFADLAKPPSVPTRPMVSRPILSQPAPLCPKPQSASTHGVQWNFSGPFSHRPPPRLLSIGRSNNRVVISSLRTDGGSRVHSRKKTTTVRGASTRKDATDGVMGRATKKRHQSRRDEVSSGHFRRGELQPKISKNYTLSPGERGGVYGRKRVSRK